MASHSAPLIEWDNRLVLGDATIDRQHKGLVALINELHSHLDAPDMEVQVMHCLTSMYLYAKEHFWDEEAFMAHVDYPDRVRHMQLHKDFVQKTHALTDHCLTDESPCEELLDFLVSWFRTHVSQEDAKLVAFAKGRGAAG